MSSAIKMHIVSESRRRSIPNCPLESTGHAHIALPASNANSNQNMEAGACLRRGKPIIQREENSGIKADNNSDYDNRKIMNVDVLSRVFKEVIGSKF